MTTYMFEWYHKVPLEKSKEKRFIEIANLHGGVLGFREGPPEIHNVVLTFEFDAIGEHVEGPSAYGDQTRGI